MVTNEWLIIICHTINNNGILLFTTNLSQQTAHVTQLSINNAIELRNNVNFLNRNIKVFCEKLRGLNNIAHFTLKMVGCYPVNNLVIRSIKITSGTIIIIHQFSILRTCKRKKLSKLDIEFLHLFGIFFRDQYWWH